MSMKVSIKMKGNGISTSRIRSWNSVRTSRETFPFPSKTKNNFRGIDISQPTPLMSLSVPLFSLDIINEARHLNMLIEVKFSLYFTTAKVFLTFFEIMMM